MRQKRFSHFRPSDVDPELWPILFLLYTADLLQYVGDHQLIPHAYADDTQIYGFNADPQILPFLCDKVSVCVDEVSTWMASNRLQLNNAKTEILWCTSSRRQHQIPSGPVLRSALAPLTCSQFLRSVTSRCLHRRWHVHEDPRHSRRQSVLRGYTSDPERAAISVTTREFRYIKLVFFILDLVLQMNDKVP